jgi:replicative DNA helicase
MPATVHKIGVEHQRSIAQFFPLPSDPDAERGLIGAVVEAETRGGAGPDDDVIAQVGGAGIVDDFHQPELRALWQLMCERHKAGLRNDVVSLFDAMRERGLKLYNIRQEQLVGWVADFAEVMGSFPSLALHYANQLREAATRRRAMTHAWELIQRLGGDDRRPLVEWYAEAVGPLAEASVPIRPSVPLSEYVSEVIDHAERLIERRVIQRPGAPSGLRELDRLLGGFRDGHLVIIGARPSIGKTALGIGVAIAIARAHGPVAYLSAEMPAREIAERIIAQTSGIELTRLWRGPLGPAEHPKLVLAASDASSLRISVDDELRDWPAVLGRLQQRVAQGCRVVIVDYLGLMRVPGDDPSWERIATITHDAKEFAKRHKVPFVLLAQLNRQAADTSKAPTMNELRGSGDIEQDADVILLIHRPNAQSADSDEEAASIIVEKHRGGPTGVVNVKWRRLTARFDDFDPGYDPQAVEDGRYGW